jgi:hypothetical protein
VTFGTFRTGNASEGADSSLRGVIVSGAAARVAATGTTYEIAREKEPMATSHNATLRRRSARRLKRSAAIALPCETYELIRFPSRPVAPLWATPAKKADI